MVPHHHPAVQDYSSCPHKVLYTHIISPLSVEAWDVKLRVLLIKCTWLLKIPKLSFISTEAGLEQANCLVSMELLHFEALFTVSGVSVGHIFS